jgi:SET domain-containing protein
VSDVKTRSKSAPKPRPIGAWFAIRDSAIEGRGAFATKFIPLGESFVEYTGERISKPESARRCGEGNPYIFQIDETTDLDGNSPDNPARFINHSCAPNCEAVDYGGHIWIEAIRDIQPGEELTFNYGYDLSEYKDHPCVCGTRNCLGYIVAAEFHDQIRARQGKKMGSNDRN